ncbi:pyridoxine 5'-phosphate oxidase C-terminal domain-containing protein [Streptomyces sp. NPDC002730]
MRRPTGSFEFWQGDKQRNHTRLNYTLHEGVWDRQLLWP